MDEKITPVLLDMTGEEFKTLVERRTANGKTDTIPELMELLAGIPDGMTLEEYVRQKAAIDPEELEEILKKMASADNNDIDEIFT